MGSHASLCVCVGLVSESVRARGHARCVQDPAVLSLRFKPKVLTDRWLFSMAYPLWLPREACICISHSPGGGGKPAKGSSTATFSYPGQRVCPAPMLPYTPLSHRHAHVAPERAMCCSIAWSKPHKMVSSTSKPPPETLLRAPNFTIWG